MSKTEKSHFPLHQALAFALQGIRLRLGRMLLVLAGVAVAIAFTNVLLSTGALFETLAQRTAGAVKGQALQGAFRWLWIAVALVISTAGTLNAIVMSVTERVKEIGTLKCLGSRNIHVVQIFLFESVLLGTLGGLVGAAAGYGAALLSFVATVGTKHLTSELAWGASLHLFGRPVSIVGCGLLCVGISATLALLASIVPVLMAAKVEPAAAMRYEV